MGQLSHFDINGYIKQYAIKVFFETGAGEGHGIEHAQKFPFSKIYSSEYVPDIFYKQQARFYSDERVTLLLGESKTALESVLSQGVFPNILFWLDAHFPGTGYLHDDYTAEANLDIRLPLRSEIETILKFRKNRKDVILIDDLRIYERGNYANGMLDKWGLGHVTSYDDNPIHLLEDDYDLFRDYSEQGCLVATPK